MKYIIFSNVDDQKEFSFTQENPLTEKEIINLFWIKYRSNFKNKKEITLDLIEEKALVNIERVENLHTSFVIYIKETKNLLKCNKNGDIRFFESQEKAINEVLDWDLLREGHIQYDVMTYKQFLTKKKSETEKIYKKDLLRRTKEKLTKEDYDFFNEQNLDKDKFFVFSTIIKKEVKDENLKSFVEETKIKFNKLQERFTQYQLMVLLDMCERSIYNFKQLTK